MAHVKGSGSVTQHAQGKRHGKRFGVKKSGGSVAKVGQVIIRQKGAKYKAGQGAKMGKDYTIFSMIDGVVTFGKRFGKTLVKVVQG
ncbi:MAG: 50S ribosomal protein L27 [Candidatus Pacebacteria bacterium CG10_big_fil_rev_8_21_14_0_10_36_11]|nr:50S ribosomal protein L27 [Candidatus Pacearchaeota archaeon]OIP74573.1 MAG: 50S ribosomal protein L27 [Candidatus Pacebacteria bacterium CG2_30_36_39]PIR65200.1 MAG: 50S ribosomal protein L27 [Candidatus Pacebacteria bacterium CG10_big_fil_rev_8_21_14_0_10_36_11]PJC42837.1 MAG: 50S ribosomal protein L27 [Candidatus Pacebacteria bacterium CG_4_9_14_0_2_um_filter_36_8]